MESIEYLISKILKSKANKEVDEVKFDLERVLSIQIADDISMGYIKYLYRYYQSEINYISPFPLVSYDNQINHMSPIDNIRNYLIKIAIMRMCKERGIEYCIENMNSSDYCMGLLNKMN